MTTSAATNVTSASEMARVGNQMPVSTSRPLRPRRINASSAGQDGSAVVIKVRSKTEGGVEDDLQKEGVRLFRVDVRRTNKENCLAIKQPEATNGISVPVGSGGGLRASRNGDEVRHRANVRAKQRQHGDGLHGSGLGGIDGGRGRLLSGHDDEKWHDGGTDRAAPMGSGRVNVDERGLASLGSKRRPLTTRFYDLDAYAVGSGEGETTDTPKHTGQ
ncbi:unnamed protein product [Phytophthora fragariaefolia]|uniref:Unnamed protein product n=1 Tax=Phytophthora fragariaefolia TaxID=1490495 RepID=A0A9W6TTK9_9STRA|nr:unnamed protein product [Phytophthora fragariaefolia]